MPPKAMLATFGMTVWCATFASCSSSSSSTSLDGDVVIVGSDKADPPGGGSRAWVVGDWDDVEAAAIVGTDEADCAIVRVLESTETTWRAEIRSVRDERGTLTAVRTMPKGQDAKEADDSDGLRITFVCTLGVFGNAEAEKDILAKTARRLHDLFGVDYAPIR